MKKLYVVKGGLAKKNEINVNSFYLLTPNLKENVGYIGKRGKNQWRLYTVIAPPTQNLNGNPDYRYYHFSSFEECIIKLKEISKYPVEIIENYFKESEISIKEVTASQLKEENGLSNIPNSERSILSYFTDKKISLTPGANYKLELYLESLKDLMNLGFNSTVLNDILDRHEERIKQLRNQLQEELFIIRPEDIPDVD